MDDGPNRYVLCETLMALCPDDNVTLHSSMKHCLAIIRKRKIDKSVLENAHASRKQAMLDWLKTQDTVRLNVRTYTDPWRGRDPISHMYDVYQEMSGKILDCNLESATIQGSDGQTYKLRNHYSQWGDSRARILKD
jgi:hypothetical protein